MLTPYVRPPIILSHGKGCKVWDLSGRQYLDFTAGIAVNALVAKVIQEESLKLVHCSNMFHNQHAGELAMTLVELTKRFGGLGYAPLSDTNSSLNQSHGSKVFFANSGAEANEGALKFARKLGKVLDPSGKKTNIVCFKNAFHGRTFGALSVTSQPKYQLPFSPLVPGVIPGDLNDIGALKTLITDETCGVIIEPIQALRARCDEVNTILIYDEIQCGLGRTGNLWAHGSLPVDCHPDVMTMAKPLANGIPIGAIMMTDRVANQIQTGDHGTTFGGGPLQTAVGNHVVKRIGTKEFLWNVTETGKFLKSGLETLSEKFPRIMVGGVRGRGLILGIDINDQVEKIDLVKELIKRSRERGMLILSCGKSTIRLVPSLIVSKHEVKELLKVLESVMVELDGEL
ncbi:pyridoxal phosphate-dependent transferase [Phakopsora pachyrhizi]|uniref:Pyridoxal phosphate-dependent transferase n=1 Tax=Phakopsora pachyrhizi TaxID=170000 RepID=A0AAV0BA15_PHAPC|nr:pyridoxal phosphate-dependent transferase [Phakopsora pachyrhizi]